MLHKSNISVGVKIFIPYHANICLILEQSCTRLFESSTLKVLLFFCDPNNIYVNINNGSAEIWVENQPECTTNCKDALEHIVQLLAVKFDANLTNKSEMIYDTVMSW